MILKFFFFFIFFIPNRQIPENDELCEGDCDHDFRFGMNENQDSYKSCKNRARNKGLFTADQVKIFIGLQILIILMKNR